MSRTNRDDSIENVKAMTKNDYEEYKEDNQQHQQGDEIFINTTK